MNNRWVPLLVEVHREGSRRMVAGALLLLLSLALINAAVTNWIRPEGTEAALAILTTFVGLVGSVVGFYFGETRSDS